MRGLWAAAMAARLRLLKSEPRGPPRGVFVSLQDVHL